MSAVFADTFFFLALLNEQDEAHVRALQFDTMTASMVTTAWILTEVGDAFSAPENRPAFLQLLDTLRANRRMLALLAQRWSCLSEVWKCFGSGLIRNGR
jgi:predicted nucleic acid-binding protein